MQQVKSSRLVIFGLALAGCILGGMAPTPAAGPDTSFKVIVHPELTASSVNRETLSAVFLRKSLRWGDGTPAQPVDQSTQAPVREAFSQYVHGQPVAAVMKFWMRQISEGRGMPPPVKTSDADVIEFVASKRGAVGYVTAQATVPGTVRVLRILD